MAEPRCPTTERIGRPLASWMCLVGGSLLLAINLLAPPWLTTAHLQDQRDVMLNQVKILDQQRLAYQRLRDALESSDPVVLEHLAYHYLALKPVGTNLMHHGPHKAGNSSTARPARLSATSSKKRFESIEDRLHRVVAHITRSTPPRSETRLAHLVMAWPRAVLIVTAGLCILIGLRTAVPLAPRHPSSRA